MTEVRVHPNVTLVVTAGAERGLQIEPFHFPDGTKTAVDAAAAIGVDVGQIVKSLIFAVDGEIVLAYVSGRNQLDEGKLAAAAGGSTCSRVDADTVRADHGVPDRRRAAVRSRHGVACVHRPGPAAVRRRVGGRRHLDRRFRDHARRPPAGERRHGYRTSPHLTTDQSVGGGGSSMVWSNIAGSTVMNRPVPRATTVSSGPDGSTSSPSMSNLRP